MVRSGVTVWLIAPSAGPSSSLGISTNLNNKKNSMLVIYIIMILSGLLGLIASLMRISKQAEKDLLQKMYKNGDIDNNVYKKYL